MPNGSTLSISNVHANEVETIINIKFSGLDVVAIALLRFIIMTSPLMVDGVVVGKFY